MCLYFIVRFGAVTEHARRHLLAEGLPHRRVYLTGSPMREVLNHYKENIESSNALEQLSLSPRKYFVVSLHREENVDHLERLHILGETLNALAEKYGFPIILSTHPRTRKKLDEIEFKFHDLITAAKPFGFHDYNCLQKQAFCVISDSGTIAEEASLLGFPAVTPRDAVERPEGLDVGCVMMTGVCENTILECIEATTAFFEDENPLSIPDDYQIENTSQRVVKLILGTAHVSNSWDGIRENSGQ